MTFLESRDNTWLNVRIRKAAVEVCIRIIAARGRLHTMRPGAQFVARRTTGGRRVGNSPDRYAVSLVVIHLLILDQHSGFAYRTYLD